METPGEIQSIQLFQNFTSQTKLQTSNMFANNKR